MARPRLVDVAGDRRRPDKADRRDVRVLQDPVHRDLVAMDDVEHAVREAGLLQQLGDVNRRGRILLRRLEDERVAAGDRVREHPHRDHRREVEGSDPDHHAEWLADREDVDASGGLLAEAALQELRDAARELDVLEPASHLAQGVGGHLAMLRGEVRRDVRSVGVHEVPDAEHDLGPLRERRRAPAGKGSLCGADGGVHLLGRGEINLAGELARCRVVDGALATRTTGDRLAADPVMDSIDAGSRRFRARPRLDDLGHGSNLNALAGRALEAPGRPQGYSVPPGRPAGVAPAARSEPPGAGGAPNDRHPTLDRPIGHVRVRTAVASPDPAIPVRPAARAPGSARGRRPSEPAPGRPARSARRRWRAAHRRAAAPGSGRRAT